MKRNLSILSVFRFTVASMCLMIFLTGCKADEPVPDSSIALDEYLSSMKTIASEMPAVAEPKITSSVNDTTTEYYYKTDYYTVAAGYDEQIVLNPATDVIYPGALIKGESLLDGTYTLIPASRKPIIISTSLTGGAKTSIVVSEPKLSTIREAINSLMKDDYQAPPANMGFTVEQANSEEQLNLSLRASYKGNGVNVKGGFDFSNKNVKTRLVAKFIQSYYTLDMDTPNKPSDLFAGDVNKTLFGTYMPMYISTVTYGRMAFFTIESSLTESEVKATLDASYKGAGGATSGSLEADFKKLKENSTMKVYILGGNAEDAANAIEGYEGFKTFIKSGGNFSKTSPGAPISYKLRYIKDNTIGKIVFAASYPIVTAIPRTDNVVYDIITTLVKMKSDAKDAGGNVELYGSIKSYPKSLGASLAHAHWSVSSSKYQDLGEKGTLYFPDNATSNHTWDGLKLDDKITYVVDIWEADTFSNDHYKTTNFDVNVGDIVAGSTQGSYESKGKVYDGTDSQEVYFKFTPVLRRLK